jgi:hypothetical protein
MPSRAALRSTFGLTMSRPAITRPAIMVAPMRLPTSSMRQISIGARIRKRGQYGRALTVSSWNAHSVRLQRPEVYPHAKNARQARHVGVNRFRKSG